MEGGMFDFRPTKKGLLRAEFKDRYGAVCSVQESSFPDEDCLWLGIEVDIHGAEVPHGRMHISQAMARQLLPVLRHFARTGKLGTDDAGVRFQVGRWVRGVGPDNFGVEGRIVYAHLGEHISVQDSRKPGVDGQHITLWDAVELHWEPIDVPDHIPTRYDRIAADNPDDDDDDDDAV